MAINYLKLMDRDADMDITSISLDSLIRSLLKKYSMLFIEKHISLDTIIFQLMLFQIQMAIDIDRTDFSKCD